MKILHLDTVGPLPPTLQKRIRQKADYVAHMEANLTEQKAVQLVKNFDVLILAPSAIKPITSTFINQLQNTKHIALVTTGYDWIDIEACKKKGISVSRPVGANSEAVAEHIFGLFIDLAKRITEFDRDVRSKEAYDFRKYTGTELYSKTLGIIGFGNVGHKVYRISKGFEMKVLAFDRSEKTTEGYEIVGLKKLLQNSDFIAICVPLTNETEGLIGKTEIGLMKDGVIIVNTAREEIVNKKAILNAIRSGKVKGYGIETAIMTKVSFDDEYLQYPNVIINPHNAFNTLETAQRVNEMVVDNIISFIEGRPQSLI